VKCLSIHQPWAWAILHAGKDVENRTWGTPYRGPLLIHASKSRKSCDAQRHDFESRFDVLLPSFDSMPKGAIVGMVALVGCASDSRSKWAEAGYCHWQLCDVRPFVNPIPWRGMQSLFSVPDEAVRDAINGTQKISGNAVPASLFG
jgi:hypothetical protein